jgi:pyrroline-5-carboxylate reductase
MSEVLHHVRIGLVGTGQMGEAILGGLLNRGLVTPEFLHASDPRAERMGKIARDYGVLTTTVNAEAAHDADIVVLATKPQMIGAVMEELKGHVKPSAIVLSIEAGVRLKTLQKGLNHDLVVRAMPNTPGRIGRGITIWTAAPQVTDAHRGQISRLLSALGEEVYVDHERYLDMATALSGSGPMYVFLFMESMVDAGVRLGLPRYLAQEMVLQTVAGSAEYARATGEHLAHLRNDVTSPGGTTAEALYELDEAGFRTAITKAISAAYRRSLELGQD